MILSELPDSELVEQVFDDLYDGLADEEQFGVAIGADAYCRDAATAVDVAKSLVLEQSAS